MAHNNTTRGRPEGSNPSPSQPNTGANRPLRNNTHIARSTQQGGLNTQENKFKTYTEAYTFLDKQSIIPHDFPPTLDGLLVALKHLAGMSQGKNQTVYESLLALTFYVDRIDFRRNTEDISQAILDNVLPFMEQDIERIEQASERLQKAAEDLAEQHNHLTAQNSQGNICNDSPRMDFMNTTASYADIARRQVMQQAPHTSSILRGDLRSRHLIIEGANITDPSTGKRYTEAILLNKARAAFDMMGDTAKQAPATFKFVAIQYLAKGGIRYELDSRASMDWIRQEHIYHAFLQNFGGGNTDIRITTHTFNTVIDFVPVSFEPEEQTHLRQLEEENHIPTGSIKEAKWMRPPALQRPDQAVATLQVNFNTDSSANIIIGQGALIAGRRLQVRRLIPAPKRCLKCHSFEGHFAADCKATHDTCGTCASTEHQTKDCTENDRKCFRCINCNTTGHAAWDRLCPAYMKAHDRILTWQPEYQFQFFPYHRLTPTHGNSHMTTFLGSLRSPRLKDVPQTITDLTAHDPAIHTTYPRHTK
ncbi:hypothetical protein NM688_g9058 [Phlebia brevispora]|uniref:Uncharacterized protein n=1 Tax=Phlebia brevispora TaxID=194682 RepID=A0ACC1RNE5_9APHY|nr:hypothetical protein NM688_g9058 [Phlebia brevispora]